MQGTGTRNALAEESDFGSKPARANVSLPLLARARGTGFALGISSAKSEAALAAGADENTFARHTKRDVSEATWEMDTEPENGVGLQESPTRGQVR